MLENNTTPIGKADLSQRPEDFKSLLFDSKESPKPAENEKPKGSAAEDPKGHPQDNVEPKPTDEKKPEVKPSDTQKPSTEAVTIEPKLDPTKPATETQLSADEQRHREAAKAIQEKTLERKRAVLALAAVAKKNPEEVLEISRQDKKLADEVVKEAFGYNSLDEYQEQIHLEDLRQTDPEKAEIEERLMKIERNQKQQDLDAREKAEKYQKEIFDKFLETKKILNNQFDAKYLQVQAALQKLSPDYVSTNYSAALETAFSIAFPQGVVDQSKVELQNALNKESQNNSAAGGGVKQSYSTGTQYSDKQNNFAENVGITLS